MAATVAPPKSTRKERMAWYLYDFGNSAYAAVVLLAIYSAYFQGSVVGGSEGTKLWGYAVFIAMLIVAITAPFLGAIADYSGAKKRFLFFFTAQTVIFTGMLFFVMEGRVVIGMLFLSWPKSATGRRRSTTMDSCPKSPHRMIWAGSPASVGPLDQRAVLSAYSLSWS